jgi:hypothetical protein
METMQADKNGFIQQSESYEHFGAAQTYVLDLHTCYESMKADRKSFLGKSSGYIQGIKPATNFTNFSDHLYQFVAKEFTIRWATKNNCERIH